MRAFAVKETLFGWEVVGVDSDVQGYRSMKERITFSDRSGAQYKCDRMNRGLGVSSKEAEAAALCSMFSAAKYDEVMREL